MNRENPSGSPTYISVIGASKGHATSEALEIAEEVGKQVALADCILVNGGLGGTMEYAAKGAKEHGGTTIGILPGPNRNSANRYIDYSIPTDLGFARNSLVAHAGDAVIALPGNWGTLSEISMSRIWEIPVVALDFWDEIFGVDHLAKEFPGVTIARTPREAVDAAIRLAMKRKTIMETMSSVRDVSE